MALRPAGDIQEGDLIRDSRGGTLYYVQEIEKSFDDKGKPFVVGFITLPVTTEENAPSGSVTLPLTSDKLKDQQGGLNLPNNPAIAVGVNVRRRYDIQEDNYFANFVGKITADLRFDIDEKYKEIGASQARISDLTDDGKARYRTIDYSIITGPVHERVVLDGDEKIKPREIKKQKAKSLVKVPDMYLEDAVKEGFLNDETYQIFAQRAGKDEVLTLKEALALVQSSDRTSLLRYLKGATFDECFPEKTRAKLDDMDVSQDPIVTKAANITIEEARANGLLTTDFAVSVLTHPDGEHIEPDEDEFDERVMFTLDEAIRTAVIDPEYFRDEYKSPTGRKLTKKQHTGLLEEIKGAFNSLAQQEAISQQIEKLSRISADVSSAYSDLIKNMDRLRTEKISFMRHDPTVPVQPRIEQERDLELEKIRKASPRVAGFKHS